MSKESGSGADLEAKEDGAASASLPTTDGASPLKTLVMIGPDSEQTDQAFDALPANIKANVITVMSRGKEKKIPQYMVPKEHFDVAILDFHGFVHNRGEKDEAGKSLTNTTGTLVEGIDDAAAALLKIQAQHRIAIACHAGGVIDQLRQRAAEFKEGEIVTIMGGAKHSIGQYHASIPYFQDILNRCASGQFHPIEALAQNAENITETMCFLKKVDDGTENGTMIGFKVRAPKTKSAIELFARDPKAYFTTCANESEPKGQRNEACIIGYGNHDSPHYKALMAQVQEQLSVAADDLTKSDYMNKALKIAIERFHDPEIIKAWVHKGADINNTTNISTPLGCAVGKNNLEALNALLEMKADVNKINGLGITPLHLAIQGGSISAIYPLVENGADINLPDSIFGTCLIHAIRLGDTQVVNALISKNADINKSDTDGYTPLYHAIQQGNLTIINSLILNGADLNCSQRNGPTLLYYAVKKGDISIINTLLVNGADPNRRVNDVSVMDHISYGNINIDWSLTEYGKPQNASSKSITQIRDSISRGTDPDIKELLVRITAPNGFENTIARNNTIAALLSRGLSNRTLNLATNEQLKSIYYASKDYQIIYHLMSQKGEPEAIKTLCSIMSDLSMDQSIRSVIERNLKPYNLLALQNIASTVELLDASSIAYLYNNSSNNEALFNYLIHTKENTKVIEALGAILAFYYSPSSVKFKVINKLLDELPNQKSINSLCISILTSGFSEAEKLKAVERVCQNIEDIKIKHALPILIINNGLSEKIKLMIVEELIKHAGEPGALSALSEIGSYNANTEQIDSRVTEILLKHAHNPEALRALCIKVASEPDIPESFKIADFLLAPNKIFKTIELSDVYWEHGRIARLLNAASADVRIEAKKFMEDRVEHPTIKIALDEIKKWEQAQAASKISDNSSQPEQKTYTEESGQETHVSEPEPNSAPILSPVVREIAQSRLKEKKELIQKQQALLEAPLPHLQSSLDLLRELQGEGHPDVQKMVRQFSELKDKITALGLGGLVASPGENVSQAGGAPSTPKVQPSVVTGFPSPSRKS